MTGTKMRYALPETAEEAVAAFKDEVEAGRKPVYYAGGTEVTTLRRRRKIHYDTLIDLKGIAAAVELGTEEGVLRLGAVLPLNRVIDSGLFPLFSRVASGVADWTVRNRLSVGGNVAGRLPYREAVLPLLVTSASAVIVGPGGRRSEPLAECFNKRLKLGEGEFVLRFEVPEATLNDPFHAVRRTGHSAVDYPIVHAVGALTAEGPRLAAAGLCAFPLLIPDAEHPLDGLPGPVADDLKAGRAYRTRLAERAFREIIDTLEAAR